MKRKIIYLLIVLIIIFMGLGIWKSWNKPQTNLNYSISKIKAAYKCQGPSKNVGFGSLKM